jgi:hypothetical protein
MEDEVGWACGTYGGYEKYMQSLGGKHIGNITLGRSKRRWYGITKMDLREIRER